MIPQAQKKQ